MGCERSTECPSEPAERVTKMIDDPATPLWRGTIALRIVTFLFAAANVIANQPGYIRPWLAWATLGVMALWSVFTSRAYNATWGRRWPFVLVDLALTCGLMSLSPLIMSSHQLLTENVPLITTIWACVPAVALGALGGSWARVRGRADRRPRSPTCPRACRASTCCATWCCWRARAWSSAWRRPRRGDRRCGWRRRCGRKRRRRNGNGSRVRSTTACSRCWPACASAAWRSVARRPNWRNSPVSRRSRCGRWSPPRPRHHGGR